MKLDTFVQIIRSSRQYLKSFNTYSKQEFPKELYWNLYTTDMIISQLQQYPSFQFVFLFEIIFLLQSCRWRGQLACVRFAFFVGRKFGPHRVARYFESLSIVKSSLFQVSFESFSIDGDIQANFTLPAVKDDMTVTLKVLASELSHTVGNVHIASLFTVTQKLKL